MSDLISRDKAIAETWRETSYSDPANVLTEIRDRLSALPSEESKIVRCKDCIWHNKNTNQCDRQICAVMYADDFCNYGERRGEQDE